MFLPSHLSALLSLGIATGLVIDCGYEETSLLPVLIDIFLVCSLEVTSYAYLFVDC